MADRVPERAKAISDLARQEAAVAGALTSIAKGLKEQSEELHVQGVQAARRGHRFDRFVWALIGLSTILIVLVIGLVVRDVQAGHERHQIDRVVHEVHSAVTPGQPIYERGQAQQALVVGALEADIDCRLRRALARLPAPRPGEPCRP